MKAKYKFADANLQMELDRIYEFITQLFDSGGFVSSATMPTNPPKNLFWYSAITGVCQKWTGKEWVQTFPK